MFRPACTECVARDLDGRDAERLDRDIANREAAAGLVKHLSGGVVMMRSARLKKLETHRAYRRYIAA